LGKSGQAFLTRDVSLSYLPAKKFWVDSILASQSVPAWNPMAFGGVPYRADLNNSPLHPLNFLFLLFPQSLDKGYLMFIAAHFLLLGIGSFLLFRRLRFGPQGSLLAALILALSGIAFSTMNLMNVASSLPALPFFFFFLLPLRKRFSWAHLTGMSLAWAWPIYSGDPQFAYWMALAAFAFVVERCVRERAVNPILRTFGAGLFALGLSAAQMLPALELAASSERGLAALGLAPTEKFSLHPLRLLEFFLPLPFGNIGIGNQAWVGRLTDELFTMPFLLHIYLGVIVAGFSFWRIFRLAKRRKLSRYNLAMLSVLALLLLAALGRNAFLDLYGILYRVVPGWKMFRYPERLLFLFLFLVFAWNGPVFRWIAWRLRSQRDLLKFRSMNIALAFLVMGIFSFAVYGFVRILEVHSLAGSFVHVFLLSALFFFFWHARARISLVKKYSFLIFCFLLMLDALPFGFQLLWRTSASQVSFQHNEFAEKIQRHIASRPEQIKVGAAARYFHGTYRGPFPTAATNPIQIGQAWDWGVMYPNISMYFGIANPGGYSPFDPKEILGLWSKHGNSDPQRLLNLFSVAYYPLPAGDRPSLQFNSSALPQAWFPAGISFFADAEKSEAGLFAPSFLYQQKAVMVGLGNSWGQSGKSWTVQNYSRLPDHVTIAVIPGSAESYFVWNERFNPSWVAYYQGKKIPISVANTWAMGVKLNADPKAGAQTLEFIYEDHSARVGNWLTIFTLFFMIIGSVCTQLPLYRRSLE
jgi:hypothetical protein